MNVPLCDAKGVFTQVPAPDVPPPAVESAEDVLAKVTLPVACACVAAVFTLIVTAPFAICPPPNAPAS